MSTTTHEIPHREIREIEARASSTLRRVAWTDGVVDSFRVAEGLGIPVDSVEFDDGTIAGGLVRDGSGTRIRVREDDARVRRNFTVAHEIGHYILEHDGDWSDTETTMYRRIAPDQAGDSPSDRAEFQATVFAGALLMPESKILELRSKGIDAPEVLARIFGVSKSALTRRLQDLGLLTPSVEGFLYADLAPARPSAPRPEAPGLSDDLGPIPTFPPLARDGSGRIVPLGEADKEARREAALRAIDAISRIEGVGSPESEAEVLRAIDEGRPDRPLFGGMY